MDLDSDGDGCNDVVEAGYVDGDNDGILGVAPYKYTSDGLVSGTQDYKDFAGIDDLDGNTTKDFLERGTALSKTLDPDNVIDIEYSKVSFTGGGATVGNLGTITYSWQITTDNGETWTNVSKYIDDNSDYPGVYSGIDSTTLVIDSITSDMDKFSFRLYMQTPAFKVIIGLRKGRSWDRALEDGWVEGETLFETEEAASRGTIIQYLLSDAGQIQMWPMVKANLKSSDALFFSPWFRNCLS